MESSLDGCKAVRVQSEQHGQHYDGIEKLHAKFDG